ncbi:c-type cytochrome [Sphingobacterium chuzhouense]|uniref:Cytochrome c n=1 Tax=Sphingobacterium chuzhouense TaxID=1742264 RepID=A0ABR7XU14_9SPHI|nr:cytochrome c [Sphingobacterium chuzhouense]MBD1422299.1 cytochrome c [Sphingobacterium chuzhouense]
MIRYISILSLAFLINGHVYAQQDIEEGRTIFRSRCASCHNIDRRLIGPALKGVDERRENQWIIDFVHSSQTMIQAGDPDAVALFEEYNRSIMPDHKDLTDDQINNIIAYIIDEGSKSTTKSSGSWYTPPYVEPYTDKNSFIDKIVYLNLDGDHQPIKKNDIGSWLAIALFVIFLIIFLHILIYLNQVMDMYKQVKNIRRKNQNINRDENT